MNRKQTTTTNKIMKKLIVIGLALVAGITSQAQNNLFGGVSGFATGGTAINAGTNWAVLPGYSGANGSTPLVTFLSVRGNAATPITLQSYYVSSSTFATATNTTTTNFVNSTNGFVAGNWLVINHTTLATMLESEARLISAVQNTNQIVLTTATTYPVLPGDQVFQETAGASVSIASSASASTVLNGPGIVSGQAGLPLLLTVSSTGVGTNTIDAVNCTFIK